MNINVPSHEPGASSLPAELRIARANNQTVLGLDRLEMGQRLPAGHHYGWARGRGNPHGVSGIGDDTTPTGVLPPITPTSIQWTNAQRTFPNLPPTASAKAVESINKVHTRYGQKAALIIARILASLPSNEAPQAADSLDRWLINHAVSGVSGMGDTCYDSTNDEYYDCGGSGGVYQTPPSGSDINWAQIIAQTSGSIASTIAVTQGGSVQTGPYGTVIQGSPGGAITQAQIPANQLNVSGAGVSGILSSPMVLLLIGGGLLLMMSKR